MASRLRRRNTVRFFHQLLSSLFSHRIFFLLIPADYKPILQEVEKILQEAGLDEEEMRRGAAGGPVPAGGVGASRNRR